jgi:divinyl chlorophyllide a 8-vinyl-reductase
METQQYVTASDVPRRILLLGATGTIGRATTAALLARGHEVICPVRSRATMADPMLAGAELRIVDLADDAALAADGFRGEGFDVLISCLASRTGAPHDAWAVDHGINLAALRLGKARGIDHFILLSAICVQKPRLGFQQAKLAFERALIASDMTYSIVRPTAFFKSLSGQVARVQAGKPFLLFGDGMRTACKPISDADLASYIADCIADQSRHNRILPIGGPGAAITPRAQGELLFTLLDRKPKFRSMPLAVLRGIVGALTLAGWFWPAAARKAELARIGAYYATESMLLWDESIGRYDAEATPSTGSDTLAEHYAALLAGRLTHAPSEHSVF